MIRLTGAVVSLLCLVPAAAASLDRPKANDRPTGLRPSLVKDLRPDATQIPPPAEAQLTTETEVYLDGRRCQYKEVPAGSSVTRMVLAPDRKTLLRVEFRSPK